MQELNKSFEISRTCLSSRKDTAPWPKPPGLAGLLSHEGQGAVAASGFDQITVVHRPRLLSDNGSSYISADLATWLNGKGMRGSFTAECGIVR